MPTNRTKRTRAVKGLDHWTIDQLVTGQFLIAGVGYAAMHSNGCSSWSDDEWQALYAAIEADWQRVGGAFMEWWRGDSERFSAAYAVVGRTRNPSITPWALEKFGEPKTQTA